MNHVALGVKNFTQSHGRSLCCFEMAAQEVKRVRACPLNRRSQHICILRASQRSSCRSALRFAGGNTSAPTHVNGEAIERRKSEFPLAGRNLGDPQLAKRQVGRLVVPLNGQRAGFQPQSVARVLVRRRAYRSSR